MVNIWLMMVNHNLVGGWPTPLKNDGVRQWEGWHPIYEMENKNHVPNHQPDEDWALLGGIGSKTCFPSFPTHPTHRPQIIQHVLKGERCHESPSNNEERSTGGFLLLFMTPHDRWSRPLFATSPSGWWCSNHLEKSAHTALAVKACLLGETATLNAQSHLLI